VQDFTFSGARDHGIPELVSLFGIELPDLTSSLPLPITLPKCWNKQLE